MRVVILSQNARAGDAIGRNVAEKVAYFLDRGAAVRVVVADDAGLHPALAAHAVRATTERVGPGWAALTDADLLCVEYPQYYSQLDWLPLLADGRRKIVFDYHGVTPPAGRSANQRAHPLDGRAVAGMADAVITHSRFTASELREKAAVADERLFRVGLPVDTEQFAPGPAGQTIQQRLGLPAEARVLLFVGRVAANKRLPILVAALADLPRDFHVAAIGPCGGPYEAERLRCRDVAADLGVPGRLHFLGQVDEPTLLDCYRSATALVIPSVHEGFCVPVVEAQACGLPVVVARAAALPETVAGAGLTFTPDDPADLARVVRRLEEVPPVAGSGRVAVVTPAFGAVSGGAERSLTLLARLLHDAGQPVTVLTTRVEGPVPAGMDVRVFAAEPGNAARRESAAAALSGGDAVAEHEFFANILRSDDLAAAVAAGDYSSVIVGPAINGVTHAAVREAGRRAILVPCLHDEPAARANRVRALFETAGGVLYHSPAERELAEAVLGLSHPVSAVLGTWIGPEVGDAARGRAVVGADRYLLVLGRKAREKNLPELFDWVRRCPRGLRVAFAGAGDFPIPDEPWAVDLGEVSEQVKRDLLAGAAALVQPSVNESLSLVVLEAMAAGVPVIGHAGCGAVAEHVRQSGAGRLARTAEEFAEAVAAVEADPALGRGGPDYIARAFRRPERMIDAVARVRRGAVRPLAATLHVAGPLAAARRRRVEWRAAFDRVIEFAVERSAPIGPTRVELRANQRLTDAASWRVEIRHFGGRPLFATGPARTTLLARVRNAAGDIIGPDIELPIPAPLHGRTLALGVELPRLPIGSYGLEAGLRTGAVEEWHGTLTTLDVTGRGPVESSRSDQVWTTPARALQTLPDGYEDVSTGRFAGLKRWLKQKLLHNFRAGYVDVLARQQSRFNRELLDGLEELTGVIDRPADADMRAVRRQLQELTRRVERLERRNATIEASR